MKHPAPERLEALCDGALPSAEAEEVRAHLRECAACGREAEALQRLSAVVRDTRGLQPHEADLEGFTATVSRRLAEVGKRRSPAWWQRFRVAWSVEWGVLQRSAAVACVLALLVGGGFVWHSRSGSPQADLPPACRIEYIEPGTGADVIVYADAEVAVVWVSGGDTG